jgi:hypothetical protein
MQDLATQSLFQFPAGIHGSPILPDDGTVKRLAREPIPEQRRLPLVGDANGGDLLMIQPSVTQGLLCRPEQGGPDVSGVVLHPAWLGVVLAQRSLS